MWQQVLKVVHLYLSPFMSYREYPGGGKIYPPPVGRGLMMMTLCKIQPLSLTLGRRFTETVCE